MSTAPIDPTVYADTCHRCGLPFEDGQRIEQHWDSNERGERFPVRVHADAEDCPALRET